MFGLGVGRRHKRVSSYSGSFSLEEGGVLGRVMVVVVDRMIRTRTGF